MHGYASAGHHGVRGRAKEPIIATTEPPQRDSRAAQWTVGVLLTLLVLVLMVLLAAAAFLAFYNIPSNAPGMAAKAVCSAAFVAGRDDPADVLLEEELAGASQAFTAVSISIDEEQRSATGSVFGFFERTASLLPDRGCVLDAAPDPAAEPYRPISPGDAEWPAGDGVAGGGTDELDAVVAAAMVGAGDAEAANTRGVAVVQGGRLLALAEAPGFTDGVALHGWSMTKTVAAMLAHQRFAEVGLSIDTPVVDAFPADREPSWVADWRQDDRAQITIADLLYMVSGLDLDEGYNPWDPVVQMLNGEPSMAGWAAEAPLAEEPGTTWEYLSAVSNILAAVVQGQFDTDEDYWQYPQETLYEPIGVTSATLESDTAGTWVGSSYLWASVTDWARFGQLMLQDGSWQGEQVLERGWLELAATPALTQGDGAGYGAQSWLPANPIGGECRDTAGIPGDTVSMEGHWGQLVAMVPSRDAVIVRLGWTFESGQFDSCRLIADAVAALPR